ncbi:MAG: LPS export ABC transporter permease LptG [Pseudomonadota bacterium]
MIGLTLGAYLAKEFLRNILLIFLLFFFLIFVVDMIELSRKVGALADVSLGDVALIALYRAPAFAENILPFAILFGAASCLILMNRRLELVVARASGVSVWQFLLPLAFTAAFVGAFASTAYNPLSLVGQTASRGIEAAIFGKARGGISHNSQQFWLRVGHSSGDVVFRAQVAQERGTRLTGVTVYRYGLNMQVEERFDASRATFNDDTSQPYFLLTNVMASRSGEKSRPLDSVKIPVDITRFQLQADQTDVESVSIWNLEERRRQAERAGKKTLPFETRFQTLLAQPLLFVAMVLVAATVSLTFARFGTNSKAILCGVAAGFVLYILTKLVVTFGSNGLVPPAFAAWSPAIVACLIGITVLMHQEDG